MSPRWTSKCKIKSKADFAREANPPEAASVAAAAFAVFAAARAEGERMAKAAAARQQIAAGRMAA